MTLLAQPPWLRPTQFKSFANVPTRKVSRKSLFLINSPLRSPPLASTFFALSCIECNHNNTTIFCKSATFELMNYYFFSSAIKFWNSFPFSSQISGFFSSFQIQAEPLIIHLFISTHCYSTFHIEKKLH